MKVEFSFLQAFFVPFSLSTLAAVADKRKVPIDSCFIPSCRLGFMDKCIQKIPALVRESSEQCIGLGQLPVIEVPDLEHPVLPKRDEVEREMCALLGPCVTILRGEKDLEALATALSCSAWVTDHRIVPKPIAWPEFPGPLEAPASGGELIQLL